MRVIKLVKVGSGMDDKSGHVTIKRSQTYLVKVGMVRSAIGELRKELILYISRWSLRSDCLLTQG